MTRRVLLTTAPSPGAFHPLVPLARALVAAGHEVAFATARGFCAVVEATGFRCFPAGRDWAATDPDAVFAHVRTLRAASARSFSPLRDVYGDFLLPPMVADVLPIARAFRPDLIVREPMEFGGCIVAEILGLPHASCGPLFCFEQGAWHLAPGEVARPSFDALRRSYGLPPDPDLEMLHRHLVLGFLPPSFVGPELTLPRAVRFLRPISFNQSGDEKLPGWMANLPDQPTVHASLGTIFHRTPGVLAAILEALRDEPLNLVAATGRDQDPAQYGPQPRNVHLERYIPHSLLLPACDLVVTHGGFSSIMACLNLGLPMVLVPLAGGDQRGNAERCAALGVGRVIGAEERTPARIRAAVRDVLTDPRYRRNAERLRAEIQDLPGPEHAVALLESLAGGTRAARAPARGRMSDAPSAGEREPRMRSA